MDNSPTNNRLDSPRGRPAQRVKSIRNKFLSTLLLVSMAVGLATLTIVVALNIQSSAQHLQAVQRHIEEGIRNKGLVLTQNHALALRGLALDNAFLDMQQLVEHAVREDADLVYGIYVNSDKETLAFGQRGNAAYKDKTLDKNAWKTLGLVEADLELKTPTVQHANRLGQDLLEVVVPVFGEDKDIIGSIRYGLSKSRMHSALSRASADSRSQLVRSVILLGVVFSVVTVLGLLLSRQQSDRISKPITQLTVAAESLAAGNREVRVDIRSGDELQILGGSFNKMVEDLDASYRELEQLNRNLELKVQQRTAELGRKNRDMRLVLDNVDQGFITLSRDGTMAAEHSAVVDRWFGALDTSVPFWEYVGRLARGFNLEFRLAWEQLIEDVLPMEVSLEQLPRQFSVQQRTYNLRYLPFVRDNQLEGMLVVIADISERLAKEREDAEQSELMQGFKRLMLDRSGFTSFLKDSTEAVQSICNHSLDNDPSLLKRTLHTLKGNAAFMGLVVVARICHALEEQLAEAGVLVGETLEELSARWAAITEHIQSFAGSAKQRIIEVPESEYAALLSRLYESGTQTEVLSELLAWQLEPVTKAFERLGEQAKALAKRFAKGDLRVEIQGNGIRLDPDTWHPFFSELTHVIRNAIDHGIEPLEERRGLSKPESGTLTFKAHATANTLSFEFGDDGRGIDWVAITHKAAQLGLPHGSPDELLQALLHEGLSTRAEVTETSGRGIGMVVLKRRIDAMGGRLSVQTVKGCGTNWIVTFPWSPQKVPTVKMRRVSIAPVQ
jgi:two-component system chemotaxis sensor kinase CheA